MSTIRRLLLVGVVLCAAASMVAAQEEGGKGKGPRGKMRMRSAERFKQMDADADGKVSLEEFKAFHKKRLEARKEKMGDKWDEEKAAKMPSAEDIFKKMDADEDGQLTQEELQKAHRERMARVHGKRRRSEKDDEEDDKDEGDDKD